MSEAQADSPMTPTQLIVIVVAAIVGIPVFIYLVIKLATGGMVIDHGLPTMSEQATLARVQPVGQAKIVEAVPPGGRGGKAVYEAVCISCHGAGLAGAPKFGDAGAWGPRIGKGFSTLVMHAIKGLNAMPPKGGASDLSDDEVARAVAFMGNAGGAKFTEPPLQLAAAAAGGKADPAVKGKEIYDSVCVACHGTGAAGAPKFGDKAAWAPRLKAGVDEVIKSAIKGKGAMPPKGGYSGSDAEFHAAAEYMINASK